jgi:hypothetical protein
MPQLSLLSLVLVACLASYVSPVWSQSPLSANRAGVVAQNEGKVSC